MITDNKKQLLLKMKSAIISLSRSNNQDEKAALLNYIGNISQVIDLPHEEEIVFTDIKGFRNFFNYIASLNDKMLTKFVGDREFHQEYIGKIISLVEKKMNNILELNTTKEKLDEADFYSIFYEFLLQYNLNELFDELIDNHNIHTIKMNNNSNVLGFSLFNPITHESDIFIGDFKYDIHSMFILAHEFGHIYDFKNTNLNAEKYNKYFYQSFFSEVFSKLFERLFLDYLISNHILENDAKEELHESELMNYYYLIASYILSLLDEEVIISESYCNLSNEDLFNIVENHFKAKSALKSFFQNSSSFDVLEDLSYTYGDIVSMFLKEEVKNYGLSSNLINSFMERKIRLFDAEYLKEWQMSPEKYQELYAREIEFIKRK